MAKIRLWCVGEEMCTEKRYSMGGGKDGGGNEPRKKSLWVGKATASKD